MDVDTPDYAGQRFRRAIAEKRDRLAKADPSGARGWLAPLAALGAAIAAFPVHKGLFSVMLGGVVGGGAAGGHFERSGLRAAFDKAASLPQGAPPRATLETWRRKSEGRELVLDVVSKTVLTAGAFVIGVGFAPALQTAAVLAAGYGVSLAGIGLYVQRRREIGFLRGVDAALAVAQEFSPEQAVPSSPSFTPGARQDSSFNASAVRRASGTALPPKPPGSGSKGPAP